MSNHVMFIKIIHLIIVSTLDFDITTSDIVLLFFVSSR